MANGGDFTIKLDAADYARMQLMMISLSKFEKEAIIQYGLRQAALVITRQGRANYKKSGQIATGKLLKAISVSVNKKLAKSYGGFKKGKEFHGAVAHLLDRGTNERYTKKGYYRGSISKGKPNTGSLFWTDAYNKKKDAASRKLEETVKKCIDMIINRN